MYLTVFLESNPYGTPTSPSLVRPQIPFAHGQLDVTSVPDSPTGRDIEVIREANETVIDLERESTKSESPEIRLSVHDVAPSASETSVGQPDAPMTAPKDSLQSHPLPNSSLLEFGMLPPNQTIKPSQNDTQHEAQVLTDHESHAEQVPGKATRSSGRVKRINGSQRHSENVFNEIESDTESLLERQQMYSAKRPKLDMAAPKRLSSPHSSLNSSGGQEQGHFLKPPIPASRPNRSKATIDELEGPQQRHSRLLITNKTQSYFPRLNNKEDAHLFHQGDHAQTTLNGDLPHAGETHAHDEDASNDHSQLQRNSPPQTTTASANAKNWSDLDLEHPLKKALSQGRKPDFSLLVNTETCDDTKFQTENSKAQEAQPITEATEQPPGKQNPRIGEQADEKSQSHMEAVMRENEVDQEGASRVVKSNRSQSMIEAQNRAEESLEEEDVDTKQLGAEKEPSSTNIEHVPSKSQWQRDHGGKDEKFPRDRLSKEKALSEKAEQMMLETDGANQLQVERLKKLTTPSTSKLNVTSSEKSKSTKYPPRTEEQKARRRENDAKRKANHKKATGPVAGPKENLNWAEQLFQNGREENHDPAGQVDTKPEGEKLWEADTKAKPSTQSTVTTKETSVLPSIRSSSPPEIPSPSRSRKSLTPALPTLFTAKSASNKGSLLSSSPLASRSSATHDTPLRSALKHNHTPTALRRSVSFVSDQASNSVTGQADPSPRPTGSSSRPLKSLVRLNNELALPTTPCGASTKILPDAQSLKKIVAEPARKEMVQQKLKVTSDKKLKGRAVNPPTSFSSTYQKEDVSADEDLSISDYSSEGDRTDEGVMAGPSSRKKITSAVRLRQIPAVRTNPQGTPIDPIIENMGSSQTATEPSFVSRSNAVSHTSAQSKSTSRSPALAVSETMSVGSGSSSRSESDLKSDSDTEVKHEVQKSGDNDSEIRGYHITKRRGASPIIKAEKGSLDSDRKFSQALQTSNFHESKNNHGEDASEQTTQVGHHLVRPAQPATNIPSDADTKFETISSSTKRIKSRSDNTRPATYRYPTLKAMAMMAEATTPEEKAAASQMLAAETAGEGGSSSSSSEDSTSGSEGEEDTVGDRKRKSGGIPGLKGVLKSKLAFS